jgi:hypothetical protein
VENDDLKEVRALAASVFASFTQHGCSIDVAVENALEVGEKLVTRSLAREQARLDVEERAAAAVLGPRNGGALARSRA